MKVAVIISGTIRKPENSLASLAKFADHDMDVFIHAWKNVANTQTDSWSKAPSIEPEEAELLQQFKPAVLMLADWEQYRAIFATMVERWQKEIQFQFTHLGLPGMFYSIGAAADLCPDLTACDLIVRMRFDCLIHDDPLALCRDPGWVIPAGRDYGYTAINDQIGFYWADPGNPERTRRELTGYFGVFDNLEDLLKAGAPFHPETLLSLNLAKYRAVVRRESFRYDTHQIQG